MKKLMNKAIYAAGIGYIGAGAYMQHFAAHPDTWDYESVMEYGLNNGYYDQEFLDSLNKELVILRSEYGYDLYGYFIDNKSEKTVIFSHGITSNIYGMLKYAKMYLDLGFNIFTYDHRNHGRSGGKNTTFGYFEKDDLQTVMEYVRERMGEDKIVGVHGESMGTATALMHQAKYHSADFVVADCGFSTMNKIVEEVAKRDYKYPVWWTRPMASAINKILGVDFYYNISPLKAVKKIQKPVFFIHGEVDDYVYPAHSREMFAAKIKGYRKIYFAKDAVHARSIVADRERYVKEIKDFLEDINVL